MPPYAARRIAQLAWRKASLCAGGECLEIAQRDGMIMLRDSTGPRGTVLHCAAGEWRSFVGDIKAGKFDGLRS